MRDLKKELLSDGCYVCTDWFGSDRYYNSRDEFHREDGPAIIHTTGTVYYLNDRYYTEEEYKMLTFFNNSI